MRRRGAAIPPIRHSTPGTAELISRFGCLNSTNRSALTPNTHRTLQPRAQRFVETRYPKCRNQFRGTRYDIGRFHEVLRPYISKRGSIDSMEKCRKIELIAGWILLFALFAGFADAGNLEDVKARKKLIMLASPHPLSAFVKETGPGQFDGLDVYIMKTFANSLGVALEVHAVAKFDDLIPELLVGKGDVIASSFSITRDRQKQVQFSEPYFPVVLMTVVQKGSSIQQAEDLAGKKGSVVQGSSQEERMKHLKNVNFHYVESSSENYQAVDEGHADFTFLDSTSVIANLDRFPNLKVAFQFPEVSSYGFAVQPGSDLLAPLNAHLKEIRDAGQLQTMIRRVLGDKGIEMLKLIEAKN